MVNAKAALCQIHCSLWSHFLDYLFLSIFQYDLKHLNNFSLVSSVKILIKLCHNTYQMY